MQHVQHPNQSNVDNLNNVRHEASRHFRNKEDYMKAKIDELENNSKIKKSQTCIEALMTKKGYHPRTNIAKDEKGDLVTDIHSILAR